MLNGLFCSLPAHSQCESSLEIKTISIDGNRMTREAVLLRELSVEIGDCITDGELDGIAEKNRQRLLNLAIFNEVNVDWQHSDSNSIQMRIHVIERFPVMPEPNFEFADRNINVWIKEQQLDPRRVNLGLDLIHNNFRGNKELLTVGGQIGYTQKLNFAYDLPFIDRKKKHGLGFSFSSLRNKELAYRTSNNKLLFHKDPSTFVFHLKELSAWYSYRPDYAVKHNLQLRLQDYLIDRHILELNPLFLGGGTKEHVLSLLYRFDYNAVDNWNYPLMGWRFVGRFEQHYTMANRKPQAAINVQFDRYLNPLPHYFVSFIARARWSFPQQEAYIFQKNLGYDFNYVRGYEYYVVDGSAFALGRVNLKRSLLDKKLLFPIRYFEVVPIRVYGKIFADAGIACCGSGMGDRLSERLLSALGVGIDILTLYDIKFRIEYSINGLGEKGVFLHKSGE